MAARHMDHRSSSVLVDGAKDVHVAPSQAQVATVSHGPWVLSSIPCKTEALEPGATSVVDVRLDQAVEINPRSRRLLEGSCSLVMGTAVFQGNHLNRWTQNMPFHLDIRG